MDLVEVTITHLSGRRAGESVSCRTWPASIGRAPSNTVQLGTHDTRASARHAELQYDGKDLYIQDSNSTNGTYVRGRRVTREKLFSGDVVEFGVGGPQLRFDFIVRVSQPPPVQPKAVAAPVVAAPQVPSAPAPAPAPAAVLPEPNPVALPSAHAGTPILAKYPAAPVSAAAPLEDFVGNAPSETSHLGTREFPLQQRNRFVLLVIGLLLVLTGIGLAVAQMLVWVLPVIFIGLFLMFTGWSFSRVNITITAHGIEYQGVWRQISIPWSDVTSLQAEKSKTRVLTHLVYTVKSPKHTITFSANGFAGGLELAQLLARRAGRKWE
ncbi:MAG: FHA domain-containing protein [Blastocatellia bacterium]|nr:FHA domain-containing protein [Blastocatellia bacterium]